MNVLGVGNFSGSKKEKEGNHLLVILKGEKELHFYGDEKEKKSLSLSFFFV